MVELISTNTPGQIALLKAMLEDAGIQTYIKNEFLSVSEARIPIFDPVLCILNHSDEAEARQIMADAEKFKDEGDGPEIKCLSCGEMNPSNFGTCWNCGEPLLK